MKGKGLFPFFFSKKAVLKKICTLCKKTTGKNLEARSAVAVISSVQSDLTLPNVLFECLLLSLALFIMADQFSYPGMQQQAHPGGYPQFHYPTASGDQNAQLLQGYALPQQGNAGAGAVPGAMFGAQSAASYSFDQSAGGYTQSSSVPVCQVGPGSQVPMQPAAGGFAYPDFSGSFNQYAGMGQNVPPGLAAMQADMQQFGPLMTNAFGQPMSANGAILEAIAHEQGLAGEYHVHLTLWRV
ncbi:unnamed protein product [Echinostoma caproni]|uniref:Uncharacterized protein n=1 Tax=Echinostoma caproni TaxID=27848 RepID=A0A183BBT0_9TREM|nr:unnamed protein product [Echinostoma caproni]